MNRHILSRLLLANEMKVEMKKIRCGEIWGGIQGNDLAIETGGIRASLFSSAADGDKGGDIYYFTICGEDMLTRIAIADVTGHGARVARTSRWLYDGMTACMNSIDGSQILVDLNHRAIKHGSKAITTAALAAFYRGDGSLLFSYAGHHPVLMRGPSGGKWKALLIADRPGLANIPLGIYEESEYDQASEQAGPGTVIALYTDGLLEARNEAGEHFGSRGLRALLDDVASNDPTTVKNAVIDRLLDHDPRALERDDVTLLIAEIL